MTHPLLSFRSSTSSFVTGVVSLVDKVVTAVPALDIMVNDVKLTAPDVVTKGKAYIAIVQQVADTQVQLNELRTKQQAMREEMREIVAGVKAYVIAHFGRKSTILALLGFLPKKKTPTPETKVEANAKGKATREARHTLGKNQKKAIKGVVPPAAPPATGTSGTPAK